MKVSNPEQTQSKYEDEKWQAYMRETSVGIHSAVVEETNRMV